MTQTATHNSDGDSPRVEAPTKGPFSGLLLFIRQVVAELRKVVTPTRQELLRYFVVVLLFVVLVMSFVFVLDMGFVRLVKWLFAASPE